MLAVSRFTDEGVTLVCGKETIRVVIIDVDRGKVKLGIHANREVQIWRDELLDRPGVQEQIRKAREASSS